MHGPYQGSICSHRSQSRVLAFANLIYRINLAALQLHGLEAALDSHGLHNARVEKSVPGDARGQSTNEESSLPIRYWSLRVLRCRYSTRHLLRCRAPVAVPGMTHWERVERIYQYLASTKNWRLTYGRAPNWKGIPMQTESLRNIDTPFLRFSH